jgi:hypothetical protein
MCVDLVGRRWWWVAGIRPAARILHYGFVKASNECRATTFAHCSHHRAVTTTHGTVIPTSGTQYGQKDEECCNGSLCLSPRIPSAPEGYSDNITNTRVTMHRIT